MSFQDFVSKHATHKAILWENDSLQLACFFDLIDQEFLVQEYRYFSARLDLKDAVKSSKQAHALFRGEETLSLWGKIQLLCMWWCLTVKSDSCWSTAEI